jgi:cytochrome c oxidase assembly protein subunit 11
MSNEDQLRTKKLLKRLIVVPLLMFGFAFALVPLYNVLCDVTGLNGKTKGQEQGSQVAIDTSRSITLEFISTVNQNLPWEFYGRTTKIEVHPGQIIDLSYYIKNNTSEAMTVQAIPSVTPGLAARHLKKIECFCFDHLTLQGKENKDLSLKLYIDPECPKNITTITLAYTLFNIG